MQIAHEDLRRGGNQFQPLCPNGGNREHGIKQRDADPSFCHPPCPVHEEKDLCLGNTRLSSECFGGVLH